MKRKLLSLSVALLVPTMGLIAQTTHYFKIQLDTRKFTNINCSLNAPCDGVTPSPLTDVYMHAGVCWHDPSNPTDAAAASLFCAQQITPFHSAVWQSVVGNWGTNPQDDGVGKMVNEGNGIFTKEFILEEYFSSPDVSTEHDDSSNVTSQPMPNNAVAYTMGIVFRDPTGMITGRDPDCKDIFIYQLNTAHPVVIKGSDISEWDDGPVSFIYQPAGIEVNELFYDRNIAPNPLTGDEAKINFFVRLHQKDFEICVYDALGNVVKNLFRGELPAGKQTARWNATNNAGNKVANGLYFLTMRSGNNTVTDKIIVNR
ncbi:MAG: T9SS type A sorting domain-containing protein [Bacteroidia bacterium]|nr:T9SS type A sorting domain-containing protein [Bacteroidia bacterium]MCZ2249613.1 T9SS type A sorting domain-containing protein [Bacteroidia bacterium]